jgi:hypothetical protein
MKRGICFVRDREGERESEGESGYGLMPDGCFHLIGVGLGRTSCVTPCSLLLQPFFGSFSFRSLDAGHARFAALTHGSLVLGLVVGGVLTVVLLERA